MADSLSRDSVFMNFNNHSCFLNYFMRKQLLENFHLKEVLKEITCFIISILESLPENKLRWKPQNPSETLLGSVGESSSIKLVYETTSSLKAFLDSKGTSYFAPLLQQLEKQPSPKELRNIWLKEQSMPLSHMWLRPSGQTTRKTQDWTQTVRLASSSKNNAEGIGTQTK